uniref:DDE Tnp4 domain-containing protein n=1 Tax=Lotus japonicus TaxID=34305 RepID=I3SXV1_LOTJA|nr:unknown [Lotus japonicus]
MQIPAHVPAKDHSRFRNKKGILAQNVLAACTFDLQFIFVYPGWEGSVSESRVLRAVLDDPDQNFPQIPQGKYYLVDMGYFNTEGFITPFQGVRYQRHEYRGANQFPRNAKELFNPRHYFLRGAILRSFTVLKARFPILIPAPQYSFQIQRDIVIAACVLHNIIRREDRNDWLFNSLGGTPVDELTVLDELPDVQLLSSMQEQLAFSLRDSIASAMWDDFLNKWDEW